jgi:flagellar hook-length control protein FliK
MNATPAPTITSRIAQPRADAASILRPDRAEDAPSFADMLAEQTEPEAKASQEAPKDEAKPDQEDAADPETATSGDSGGQEPTDTQAMDEKLIRLPVAGGADAAAATIRGVKRELTHAATVDLAQLARDELVAEPVQVRTKLPGKFPGGPGSPLGAAPAHPNLSAGGGTPSSEPGIRPEPISVEPPRPDPRAVQRSDPSRPVVQETGIAASAEPARAEAARTQAAAKPEPTLSPIPIGRSELLTRLTGSAEAARGAVAGVDRAGGHTVERDARPARPQAPPADLTPRATKEQVLASVQRGLASVLTQGGGRMTVVLRPEQLGEVRVRMEARDGVVNARLSATTEAARQTLESGLESLRAALESRGIRVESLTIDAPDPQSGGQSRADGDAHGGRQHRGQAHEPHPFTHARADTPAAGSETPSVRGIWTEIGIDAVA